MGLAHHRVRTRRASETEHIKAEPMDATVKKVAVAMCEADGAMPYEHVTLQVNGPMTRIGSVSADEEDALERADRLIGEGVKGERGLIAAMILEAVQHERDACADKLNDAALRYNKQRDPGMANHCRLLARTIRERTEG